MNFEIKSEIMKNIKNDNLISYKALRDIIWIDECIHISILCTLFRFD